MPDHHNEDHVTIIVPVSLAGALIEALRSAARPVHDPRTDEILATVKRIETMGTTVSQQLDDAATRDEAAMAKLSTDLAAIAAELKATAPAPGSTVTQAQADRHTAIATALEAASAAADALVTPPAPPATA
jgi:hypothetical protein